MASPDGRANCLDDHYLAALEVAVVSHEKPPESLGGSRSGRAISVPKNDTPTD
jgi:hypothetical protein